MSSRTAASSDTPAARTRSTGGDAAAQIELDAALAAQRDGEALSRLYDRYADHVINYLLLRTKGDLATAEDLASATWERVARRIDTYAGRGPGGFVAWLMKVSHNTAIDYFRGRVRMQETLVASMLFADCADGQDSPEECLERKVTAERLTEAVHGLPRAQRQVVHMRFVVGLSLVDAASVLGRSVGAVKQLQHRGVLNLREALRNDPLVSTAAWNILTPGAPGATMATSSTSQTATGPLEGVA